MIFTFAFQSCQKKEEVKVGRTNEIRKPNDSLKTVEPQSLENIIQYAVDVKEVDSVQYYAAKKINKEYVKIIQLDEEFEKLTKVWVCTVGELFWSDEKTIYLTETNL